MSTNLIPIDLNVPAHLQNRVGVPSTLATSLGGGIGGGLEYPRISIKGSRFRIVENGTEAVLDTTSLRVIVVGANPNLSKMWYASAWTPDADASAPDCFSLDGVAPDPASEQPQSDVCATCPQNAWGSKVTPTGSKVKACADQKRVAVVAADDSGGQVYLLQVTPAALKGLNQYQRELTIRGLDPSIVVTIVSFDTSASFPKLTFGFGGFISEEAQVAVDKLLGTDKVREITGELVQGVVAGQVAQAAQPAAEPQVSAPAQAEEKVTTGFGTATAAQATTQKATTQKATTQKATTQKATGFGPATPTEQPIPQGEAKPAQEPEAAPATDANVESLAAEIKAMMDGDKDDG